MRRVVRASLMIFIITTVSMTTDYYHNYGAEDDDHLDDLVKRASYS